MKEEDQTDDEHKQDGPELYYLENGLIVFTREYHLQRGYCCKSGCRHCPYGFHEEKADQ